MSLLIAVATATALAAFGVPYRHFQCWVSRARFRAVAFVFLYFALAGVGGGLVGWGSAQLAGTQIPGQLEAQGLVFGLAGSLALRADFRSGKPGAAERGRNRSPEIGNAASILGTSLRWTMTALDEISGARRTPFSTD